MIEDILFKRAYWRSRRGLLELDLILLPFVEKSFSSLSVSEKQQYLQLLEQDDHDILNWVMAKSICEQAELTSIVELIHQQHYSRVD